VNHLNRPWRARQRVFDALCEVYQGALLERDMVDQSKIVFLVDSSAMALLPSHGTLVGIVVVQFEKSSESVSEQVSVATALGGGPSVAIFPSFPPGASAVHMTAEDYKYNR
jgi:hypothetical protein